MTAIDEVKQRLDIVEVVSKYTPLTKAGRNFKAVCPFHQEKTPSVFVFPERQSWHCFGACNTGGDAISFVMKKESMTFGEALHFLADKVGVLLPTRIEPAAGRDEKERHFQANEVAMQFYHNQLVTAAGAEKVRAYLQKRGIDDKTITTFQLGYSPAGWEALKQYLLERGFSETELLAVGLIVQSDSGGTHDRFRDKLMIPIRDARGRTTGFGSRVLDNSLPKYINSPQTPVFDKSETLYGIDLAANAIKKEDRAVIVEGYMDVILAHQYGFNNVIASMGVAITEKQVRGLKRYTPNLVLALDPDAAGEEAMLRCLDYENTLGVEIKVIVLPNGKDPDEVIIADQDRWRELVEKAMAIVEFTIEKKTAGLDLNNARDKSTAVNLLLPVIGRVKDDIRRDHYLTRLSKLTGISYNKLEDVLQSVLTRPSVSPRPRPSLTAVRTQQTLAANPREEYCLTLLLHFPELKTLDVNLLPDYFQDTENREIYTHWLETDDMMALKNSLDPAVRDKMEALAEKEIIHNRIAEKYEHCILLMEKEYLQNQEAMRKEIFSQEAETGGHKAALERLQKEGMEPSKKLGEIDFQRAQLTRRARK